MISNLLAQIPGLKCGREGAGCDAGLPHISANLDKLQIILGIIFGVAAALAILTIVIAGFNFATAGSDAEKISRSKKAILYALIGLVIAFSAEVIIFTVLGKL